MHNHAHTHDLAHTHALLSELSEVGVSTQCHPGARERSRPQNKQMEEESVDGSTAAAATKEPKESAAGATATHPSDAKSSPATESKKAAESKKPSTPPPTQPTVDNEKKFSSFGLGKGIDVTRSYKYESYEAFDDSSLLLDPVDDSVEILRDGVGRGNFSTSYDAKWDKDTQGSATLDTPALKWLKIDVGLDSLARGRKRQFSQQAIGYQIITRVVAFKRTALLDSKRKPSLVETILEEEKVKRGGGDLSAAERLAVCAAVIGDERLNHATHFVHTIELGAKSFKTVAHGEVDINRTLKVDGQAGCCGGASASASSASPASPSTAPTDTPDGPSRLSLSIDVDEPDGGGPGIHVSFQRTRSIEQKIDHQRIRTIADPNLDLPPPDGDSSKVTISESQEAAIGFRLAPISLLIRDSEWKAAMEEALKNDHVAFLSNEDPLVDTSMRPYLYMHITSTVFLFPRGSIYIESWQILSQERRQSSRHVRSPRRRRSRIPFCFESASLSCYTRR